MEEARQHTIIDTLEFSVVELDTIAALLKHEDDLGTVLRVHVLVERAVRGLVARICGEGVKLADDRAMNVGCNVLGSFGIPPEVVEPCRALNAIRNRFAHHQETKIGAEHLSSLTERMHEVQRTFFRNSPFQEVLGEWLREHWSSTEEWRWRFMLCAIEHAGTVRSVEGKYTVEIGDLSGHKGGTWYYRVKGSLVECNVSDSYDRLGIS